jgi:hypothetical protein
MHIWQNSFSQLVGTVTVRVKPDADEQTVLETVHRTLGRLLQTPSGKFGIASGGRNGELTVQVVK